MKSSVINSGNGGAAPQQTATSSAQIDGNNNPQQQQQNPRYPFYDFNMDDPRDFFTNPALRSRLSRMRNPWNMNFGAPRKRQASNQAQEEEDSGFVEDPHDSFFSKFDPHWSEAGQWPRSNIRKRQPNDFGHGDFFDHFPAEFRQYIPDDFGFHHPVTVHQHPPPRQAPPQAEKPRFCDAAMQTDDEPPTGDTPQTDESAPLKQHGLRNTVDLGQKSPPEEIGERAKSAPPESETEIPQTSAEEPPPPASPSQAVRHIPIIVERTEKPPVPQPPKRGVSQKKFVLKQEAPAEVPETQPEAPPTPSAESIAKIQQIQKDVLELMFKVEAFQGTSRSDKEYMFLDEMLTRNLLKLDTIDTKGNDSIRLARREAIKCIQASLSVLEAKADGAGKSAQDTQDTQKTEEKAEPEASAPPDEPQEEANTAESAVQAGECESASEEVDKSKIPIPLPPIEPLPQQVDEDGQPGDGEKLKKKKVIKKVVKKESESTAQNDDQQT
ncbi:BAG domain-containing protein Samui [Phlebotomus argentipes]|uniref:BAG domain-containing protein Samui n=1 Tax=Phlebotomus argentipes TaxID=94469 RepID=UPI0028934306|nr:BAG domain-containing protein Samui [Phlebotomus argentipes]